MSIEFAPNQAHSVQSQPQKTNAAINAERFLAPPSFTQKLCQGLTFALFRNLRCGELTVILPDGTQVKFTGPKSGPTALLKIKNRDFFKKVVVYGDIGFGESYTDEDWETDNLFRLLEYFITNVSHFPLVSGSLSKSGIFNLLAGMNRFMHYFKRNNLIGSRKNIEAHYDLSNNFFSLFLDPTMTYSSAYFSYTNESLESAQTKKYDRLCKKLRLKENDTILEIGCGWGGFALHAAKHYGCEVTGLTLSKEQLKFAQARVIAEGLEAKIKFLLLDYRHARGSFDKIVSIEMLEAVGDAYYESFFTACNRLLKQNGLLALQVITCPDSRYQQFKKSVDWIQKHIFPGSLIPSLARLNQALERTGEIFLHSLDDLGHHYSETLHRWHIDFNLKEHEARSQGFDKKFIRKWNYYLQYCQAAFYTRNITVVQALYTRANNLLLNEPESIGR